MTNMTMRDQQATIEQSSDQQQQQPPARPKLSTLIRRGSVMVNRQLRQTWVEMDYHHDRDGHIDEMENYVRGYWGACALGAACAATFTNAREFEEAREGADDDAGACVLMRLHAFLGYDLESAIIPFPRTVANRNASIRDVVVHLNDSQDWSFEAIATWLEMVGL